MMSNDVTIIVCTYNRAPLLRDALASLSALETGGRFRYEVVVVDNASSDETSSVIEHAARNAPVPIRGVYEPREGVACARNRGINEASGQWIAFFDDDQVADPNWLAELLAMAREKRVRCVGGANRLFLPNVGSRELSPACRALLGEAVRRDTPRRYSRKTAPGTGNLLIHRSVFEKVGTFDESLREAGEDTDLYGRIYAAKIEAWYTPKAIAHHVVPPYRLNPDYLRWKSLRNGGHLARRNLRDWGRVALLLAVAARLAQALALNLPRLVWARLRRAEEAGQGAQCLLWRAEGYTRFALSFIAPRLFAQRAFFSRLEFRAERHTLAHD